MVSKSQDPFIKLPHPLRRLHPKTGFWDEWLRRSLLQAGFETWMNLVEFVAIFRPNHCLRMDGIQRIPTLSQQLWKLCRRYAPSASQLKLGEYF